ncbi:hypothetical protein M2140_000146 [Clostridiales Family XIII bacterium PM5-7]
MFEAYRNRLGQYGKTDKEASQAHRIMVKEVSFKNSQSYKSVVIDGKNYDARITKDVNDTFKTGSGSYRIEFRDGVYFPPGTYINVYNETSKKDDVWMLINISDNPIFPLHIIKKCAYNLKWKNENGEIIERMIAFDDSYKIYDGIRNYGYRTNLPEASLVVTIPYDNETTNIRYDKRFLIDYVGTIGTPEAYSVTNRNAISRVSDGHGVITLSLTRDQFNYTKDNAELMIADYYTVDIPEPQPDPPSEMARAEITNKGSSKITMGTPYKEFVVNFYDSNGNIVEDVLCNWELKILPELMQFFTVVVEGQKIQIKTVYNENLINYSFKLYCENADGSVSTEKAIKVVSGI